MTLLSALLLFVAPHGLLVPRMPLSRRSCLRCKDPVAALPRPVLDPLAEAAEKAVTDSTGAGEESSGSGRPEWGTWCDSELFAEVKSCLNRVALHTAEGDAWGGLWEAVGGEAPSGTLRLAAGKQWDLLLHIWSPAQVEGAGLGGGEGEDDALHGRALSAKHADGTLCLLRPLLGRVKISKLRPSGEVFGSPRELQGGTATVGAAKADGAYLQIGGPTAQYAPLTSTAACLELVLRHETQASSLSADLPALPSALLPAFRDRDAPPPPPPSPPPPSAEAAAEGEEEGAARADAVRPG